MTGYIERLPPARERMRARRRSDADPDGVGVCRASRAAFESTILALLSSAAPKVLVPILRGLSRRSGIAHLA